MARRSSPTGPVPPGFVMAEYVRELPPELSASVHLLFALRSCLRRVNADLARWLGASALSPGRMQMLMVLWASKEPVPQSDLVRYLGVSRASVSELVETLEREGLVSSAHDPGHGRRMLISLTEAGRSGATTQIHDNAERLTGTFASLDADEQSQLVELLQRLCADTA